MRGEWGPGGRSKGCGGGVGAGWEELGLGGRSGGWMGGVRAVGEELGLAGRSEWCVKVGLWKEYWCGTFSFCEVRL